MQPEKRAGLLQAQTALAQALSGKAPAPPHFDPNALAVATSSLIHKRLQAAQRAWPSLARAVGEEFPRQFPVYAAQHAVPPTPRDDASAFARFLEARGKLPRRFVWPERFERWSRRFRGLTRSLAQRRVRIDAGE